MAWLCLGGLALPFACRAAVQAGTPAVEQAGTAPADQASAPASGQPSVPAVQQAGAAGTYTLQTSARAVLTDVVVLDSKGRLVTGLPQSAFHIFEDNKPQPLNGFETHLAYADEPRQGTTPSRGYTNDYSRLPPVVNVMVIDTTYLALVDQMFLAYQLEQFVHNLPAGHPLAIYVRLGPHSVQVQNFTDDRQLLLDAVHRCVPSVSPHGTDPLSDASTLHQIAMDLSAVPGRKNVLWFTAALAPTVTLQGLQSPLYGARLRLVYDELQKARIAVYPIDARGLPPSDPFGLNAHAVMRQVAEATGGVATYNDNRFGRAADQVVADSDNFYTLSYTPHALAFDRRWHHVRVAVDGRDANGKQFQLSYRHGFFADDSHREERDTVRTRLTMSGDVVQERPSERARPIVFRAEAEPVVPGATQGNEPTEKPGQARYLVRLTLPAAEFQAHRIEDRPMLRVGFAVIVTDMFGRLLQRAAGETLYTLNEDALRRNPHGTLTLTQPLALRPGQTYVYVATWDPTTARAGSLTFPLDVPKHP